MSRCLLTVFLVALVCSNAADAGVVKLKKPRMTRPVAEARARLPSSEQNLVPLILLGMVASTVLSAVMPLPLPAPLPTMPTVPLG
ncbi:hypothetical protein GALL_511720 [mine drainage metagenome]|uniref:Uncharacterized protein n=1 Tax=mine drainage metagenome TaxID=410659 RepID=A0A1J5PPM9_9ZZZZ